MIKIAPATTTQVTKLVQILFKVCFIPLKIDTVENKFTFRLCSSVTAISFLVYWGFFIGLQVLTQVVALKLEDVVWENKHHWCYFWHALYYFGQCSFSSLSSCPCQRRPFHFNSRPRTWLTMAKAWDEAHSILFHVCLWILFINQLLLVPDVGRERCPSVHQGVNIHCPYLAAGVLHASLDCALPCTLYLGREADLPVQGWGHWSWSRTSQEVYRHS